MNLAAISVCALVVAIVVSCISTLNVGVLSIAMAWIIGVYIGGLSPGTVMGGFPSQLFLTLAGVTLFFAMAQGNGTLDRVAHHAVKACRGRRGVVPIMYFFLAAALSSIGPGNIATAAILAPLAMATAASIGVPPFLMAIMVGNGASAGSLSPFAPAGIVVNEIMASSGMPGLELPTYLSNLAAHAAVALGGYFLLGGTRLFVQPLEPGAQMAGVRGVGAFEVSHWLTLAAMTALLASVILFDVNVGMGAFAGAVVLVLAGSADDTQAVARMPWRVILMVCGVTVLIALLERTQGIDLLVSLVARVSTSDTVTGVVAFLTGIVSIYSSTSGVVLPAFLPMVPGLARELGGVNPVAIAASINIGGHLVDVSPLSTIGALCVAAAPVANTRDLFNKLLAWGLSMSVVGAALCYLVF
jgi:di/tricarboxylate transporter